MFEKGIMIFFRYQRRFTSKFQSNASQTESKSYDSSLATPLNYQKMQGKMKGFQPHACLIQEQGKTIYPLARLAYILMTYIQVWWIQSIVLAQARCYGV